MGGGRRRERKRKDVQVAKSHTACCPPAPEPLGTEEKKKGPNWRPGRDWVIPRGTPEHGPQGIPARQGKGRE